jgi:superfamily II DNA or RNA helicase
MRIITPDLPPTHSQEEFDLHVAALEWSLAEPIIINSAADIKSAADWKGRVEPYQHQVQNLMRFCRRLPVTLLADDVGLGKTISAGLIISELMKRSKVKKVFVVCPNILIPQWVEELDSKFAISAYGGSGSNIRWASKRDESVIVTTYQSATGFLDSLETGLFDMLILDEAHKVRNLHGTKKPPKMATAIYKALEARMFKYVLMLTATPIQNRLWDIYSLIDCLAVARGHRNPLGSPDSFADRYIDDGRVNARKLRPHVADEFRKIVGTYMFRTRRVDAQLAFPDRKVQNYPVTPTADENRLQQLIGRHIHEFSALAQTSLLVALMSSPQALAMQLQNMASKGTASEALAKEVDALAARVSTPAKVAAVLRVINDLKAQGPHWRMVIFTTRTETQEMIGRVLERNGVRFGFIRGAEATRNRQTIERFRKDDPEINVIVSTDAGAEGVNLQASNILVNYDLPWNPMIVEQRIGRVQRIGSKFKNVWVANIVHDQSPEQKIVVRLLEKLQVIAHTVGDIEAVLEATDDSDGESLEKQIREMVVAALQGQDQEYAARAAEQSIENARKLIEENQAEIDRTLGTSKQGDEVEVPMPRLMIQQPKIPLQDFVMAALKAEGGEVIDEGQGTFRVRGGIRAEERFCFTDEIAERQARPGVFHGRSPVVYQAGRPAFERLVQRWLDRAAVYLAISNDELSNIEDLSKGWVTNTVGANFVNLLEVQKEDKASGELICRTRVSNAVDSYEKISKVTFTPSNRSGIKAPVPGIPVKLNDVVPHAALSIERELVQDDDLRKFEQYYQTRLANELKKTSADRMAKLENDLKPSATAEVVAVSGIIRRDYAIAVQYRFGSSHTYRSILRMSDGKIVGAPDFETCWITNCLLPADCLEVCSFTGKKGLSELMVRSEESQKLMLPELSITCPVTAKRFSKGEGKICSITKEHCITSALVQSQVSGKWALPEYVKNCEITGIRALSSELLTSGVSGKTFRADQAVNIGGTAKVAHQSELLQCEYSKLYYPADELLVSDVTKRRFHKDRLVVSELSGHKGDITEKRTFSDSGVVALCNEAGTCSVTGRTVALKELVQCAETKQLVLPSCLVECQQTHAKVIPGALGKCSVTGKVVRKSILGKSEVSGKACLMSLLHRCEATGKLMLESELGKCEKTGKKVDARLLHKCSVSGMLACQKYMVKSNVSGKWVLTEYAIKLPNDAVVAKNEVAVCAWSVKYIAINNSAVCNLCGLTFSRDLINTNGEFKLLRECLDGQIEGNDFPDPQYLARAKPKVFAGIGSFRWISSENGKSHIMFGRKSIFGIASKYFAVVATGDMLGFKLLGNAVFGKRIKGVWQVTESYSMR